MKLSLVQILVVVANIKVKTFKPEEEKGFLRTANDQEWIDPKVETSIKHGVQAPQGVRSPTTERETG